LAGILVVVGSICDLCLPQRKDKFEGQLSPSSAKRSVLCLRLANTNEKSDSALQRITLVLAIVVIGWALVGVVGGVCSWVGAFDERSGKTAELVRHLADERRRRQRPGSHAEERHDYQVHLEVFFYTPATFLTFLLAFLV